MAFPAPQQMSQCVDVARPRDQPTMFLGFSFEEIENRNYRRLPSRPCFLASHLRTLKKRIDLFSQVGHVTWLHFEENLKIQNNN